MLFGLSKVPSQSVSVSIAVKQSSVDGTHDPL